MQELHRALRPGGILFSSNPRGNSEGWSGQRYGHFMEFETSKAYLEAAGFTVLEHYYRPQGHHVRSNRGWPLSVKKSG